MADNNSDKPWSDAELRQLVQHIELGVAIEDIAEVLNRDPARVLAKARTLGYFVG